LSLEVGLNYVVEVLKPLEAFDPRSIRSLKKGDHIVKIGCPKGKFAGGRCQVGTESHSVWHPIEELDCMKGAAADLGIRVKHLLGRDKEAEAEVKKLRIVRASA